MDSSAIPEGSTKFQQLFSSVPTDSTKDTEKHLKNLQDDWNKRGFTFDDNDKISLVSVVLHDQIDEDQLFIGHVGVLFTSDDENLYFLEKIAFQEPYQLCKFSTRTQLCDYLMKKYDTDYNQTSASPLVLENDKLIEGYPINTDK